MNDTNQIIAALHKRADQELENSIESFMTKFRGVMVDNLADTWSGVRMSEEVNNSAFPHLVTAEQVTRALRWWLRNACRERKREQAVAAFMARVATLSKDIDEIRSIAEQGQSQ